MPRRPRLDFEGAVHHVINRGVDRQAIFFADIDRVEFGRLLGESHRRFGLETLAYCLMDNHFHLVVQSRRGNLSDAIGRLAADYVRHTNDRLGRDGPLFRGRFVSIPVGTADYLRDCVRYVHRNALDVAGVRRPEDYRWSSYRAYLGLRRSPDFLRTDSVLSMFGDDRAALAEFTEADRGSDHLRAHATSLLSAVRREIEIARLSDARSPLPRERLVLTALLDRVPTSSSAAIAELLGFPSPQALRSARSRARRRVENDPHLRRLLERALD